MRLPTQVKLSKIAARSYGTRPILSGALAKLEKVKVKVWHHPSGERSVQKDEEEEHIILYATDGYCFVRVDAGVPGHGDVEGPIPLEALKHMERGVNCDLGEKEIKAGITRYDRVMAEAAMVEPDKYPQEKWDELTPGKIKRPFRVGIGADVIARAAAALGATGRGDAIELEFDLEETSRIEGEQGWETYLKPIGVRPMSPATPESFQAPEAIFMPVRINV